MLGGRWVDARGIERLIDCLIDYLSDRLLDWLLDRSIDRSIVCKMGLKWIQNGSKTGPKWVPNGSQEGPEGALVLWGALGWALGGPKGLQRATLGDPFFMILGGENAHGIMKY